MQTQYVGSLCCWWACVLGHVQWAWLTFVESLFDMTVKTSCHMWGNWYLPMFLLRVESWTLMNMASVMVLVMLCDPYPLCQNCPIWYDDLRCWHSHRWGKVPWDAPWVPQSSLQTPLCSPLYTPTNHTCTCILLHFSGWCCPCPQVPPGGLWWYCLLEMDLYTYLTINILDTFTETFDIRNYNGAVILVVHVVGAGVTTPEIGVVLCVAEFMVVPGFKSIEGWSVECALSKSFPYVFVFLK